MTEPVAAARAANPSRAVRGFVTDPAAQVAAAFRTIHETRMRDVPLVNPAIAVEAVGFAPWDAHWLGCLVTPWFMNLMLLPRDPERWIALRPGEKHTYLFPAGAFEFIAGRDEAIGDYQSCSLFSPMFEFTDHEGARLTAQACLAALFDAGNRAESDVALLEKRESLAQAAERAAMDDAATAPGAEAIAPVAHAAGEHSAADAANAAEAPGPGACVGAEPPRDPQAQPGALAQRLARPLSKREFLRGRFLDRDAGR